MKKLFLILTTLALIAVSCDIYPTEQETPGAVSSIAVVKSDIYFSPMGGEGSIFVNAKGPVSAQTSASWCHLSVVSDRLIEVTADRTNTNQSRYAKITLSCNGEETYVVAEQTGIIVYEFSPVSHIDFDKTGGSVSFPYNSETPLTVSSQDDWVVTTINEDGLTIFVNEYAGYRVGQVSWSIQGYESGIILIEQDGRWKNLGTCEYTDAFMSAAFNVDDLTYPVAIQKSLVNDGVFRLINPYGEAYPYNEPGDYDTTAPHYMIINAKDHDNVSIEEFQSGMDWSYGEFVMKSTKPGTLKDKVITFPVEGLALYIPGYGWFDGNADGTAKIDMSALYF